MTPAVDVAKKAKISFNVHEYEHDPSAASYGEEAAEKLGIDADQVFKTLVVESQTGDLHVCILPVSSMLSLKSAAKAFGIKKAKMADKDRVQRTTGYVLGGVSPLGQKKRLPTVVDASAKSFDVVFVSAGKRGLEISLSPGDLCKLTGAKLAHIAE